VTALSCRSDSSRDSTLDERRAVSAYLLELNVTSCTVIDEGAALLARIWTAEYTVTFMNVQRWKLAFCVVSNNRYGIMNLSYINFYNNNPKNNADSRMIWRMGNSWQVDYCYLREITKLITVATFGSNGKSNTIAASYQVFVLNTADCQAIPQRSHTVPVTLTDSATNTVRPSDEISFLRSICDNNSCLFSTPNKLPFS
jgi:hypothetical protein